MSYLDVEKKQPSSSVNSVKPAERKVAADTPTDELKALFLELCGSNATEEALSSQGSLRSRGSHIFDAGRMTLDQFKRANRILHAEHSDDDLDIIFNNLAIVDHDSIGLCEFIQGVQRGRFLKHIVHSKNVIPEFEVPSDYDWTKSTNEHYKNPNKDDFVGEFAEFRKGIDYNYHVNYSHERQLWQDHVIRSVVVKTTFQAHPWVVYTCGPMGAGKGYALSWMSERGYYPMESIVHIDPDYFKSVMSEWNGYCTAAEKDSSIEAGTLCHRESGFIQEIAQEVALRYSQNVWVDGSMKDGKWFKHVFQEIRKKHRHYRIAVFYVFADEKIIRARIKERERLTGRGVPEEEFKASFEAPDRSLGHVISVVDFIARINNNENAPRLETFESVDNSGCWDEISKRFARTQPSVADFPNRLAPLYVLDVELNGTDIDFSELQKRTVLSNMAGTSNFVVPLRAPRDCQNYEAGQTHRVQDELLKTLDVISLSCSPVFPITATPTTRQLASIPGNAFAHSFCYGIRQGESAHLENVDESLRDDPMYMLLINGGYIFFDIRNTVVGVTAIAGAIRTTSMLQFGPATSLCDTETVEMRERLEDRWRAVTLPFMLAKGCTKYAWVLPGETFGSDVENNLGGFAYQFDEDSGLCDRIFPILPANA